jgi:siroheme synthase
MAGGLAGSTPIAVVERAWTSDQRVVRGRLDELSALEVNSPAIIVVGQNAALDVSAVLVSGALSYQ